MKMVFFATTIVLLCAILFWGGVYYGWLAQTRIPSDPFYLYLSTILGLLSYAVFAFGIVFGILKILFRKK